MAEAANRAAPAAIGATRLIGARVQAGSLDREALARVQKASVRLMMVGEDGQLLGSGSGTIVREDGLILTNAHVADPDAPGLAAQYGYESSRPKVAYLRVGITSTPDEPVEYLYNAKLVVSDGYLDLAFVQVHQSIDGQPLPFRPVLPTIPIGSADDMSTGDDLTVVGFPGISNSETATVTSGELSAYVTDSHLASEAAPLPPSKAFFETTAAIRHGNSGGTAVNSAGEMIGVPTRLAGEGVDISMRIRPIDWALELARSTNDGGRTYRSPYLVEVTGQERVEDLGLAKSTDCSASRVDRLSGESSDFAVRFSLAGVDPRLDVYAVLAEKQEGTWTILGSLGFGMVKDVSRSGCLAVVLPEGLPDGQWGVALLAGPAADDGLAESLFAVGADANVPTSLGDANAPTRLGDLDPPSTDAECRAGAPVSTWPFNQAIYVPEVTRQAGGVLFPGGKAIVVSALGSTTGYRDEASALSAARAAVRHDLGPWPIQAAKEQRWVVVRDSAGTYWALQAQRREPYIVNYSADTGIVTFPNPVLDTCETPPGDYTLVAWFATDFEDSAWLDYDSTTNSYIYTS